MKEFSVSLVITSPSLSLDELSSRLGRVNSPGSHNRGDPRPIKRSWAKTVWYLDSGAPKDAPLEQHIADLERQFPASQLLQVLPDGCTVLIDVAIFFDTFNGSAHLSSSAVEVIRRYGAALEVTCYPDFEGIHTTDPDS
jgi:hypothetical protein